MIYKLETQSEMTQGKCNYRLGKFNGLDIT